jgi:hypothetical protein
VHGPTNCIPFDRLRGRRGQPRLRAAQRRPPLRAEAFNDIFDHLSPAQCAFLSGVLAILAEHGEDALTRSCEMVIERFKRGQAG